MDEIPVIKRLKPYFSIASDAALASPCTRRQYGAVIVGTDPMDFAFIARTNARVSRCCGPAGCARDRAGLRNGEQVEVGGEIHAETAAIIDYGTRSDAPAYFVLVGFKAGHELLGTDVYPCHSCAIHLKYAGFDWIYLKDYRGEICPVSVSDILEYREMEWEYDG